MKVAVVGLGAAGLRAAMLLEQQGIEVALYEARDRLGGRIYTVRKGPHVYEAGAEWLDSEHRRLLALLNELGIEPEPAPELPRQLLYQGQRCSTDNLWPDLLSSEAAMLRAAEDLARQLDPAPWNNASREDLDRRTLDDFLREHAATERALWWLRADRRSDEGDDPDRVGLLGWLMGVKNYESPGRGTMSAYRLSGGMSRLIDGMATRLKAQPQLGKVLQRVEQDETGVTLHFAERAERCDWAVLALPAPVLRQIGFNPPLPEAQREALAALGVSRVIKICLRFNRRWWRDGAWSGFYYSDGPLQQGWDGSHGDGPVINGYICGDQADHWTAVQDPVREYLRALTHEFPEAASAYAGGTLHNWISDPFSAGAWAHLPPGFVLTHSRHLREQHGRVSFAGEWTALWTGFVEGALESADRAADEVLQ
jgi:monoamine oxidase